MGHTPIMGIRLACRSHPVAGKEDFHAIVALDGDLHRH